MGKDSKKINGVNNNLNMLIIIDHHKQIKIKSLYITSKNKNYVIADILKTHNI